MNPQLRTIETQRLQIRQFPEELISQRYVSWLNDAEVVRYSEQRHRTHTLESAKCYWEAFEQSPNLFFALVSRDADIGHIGNITVDVDLPNLVADMAILIGEKSVWGQGYGTEAWGAIMAELHLHHGIRKVTAGTMALNMGMLAIMERTGMVREGRKEKHFLFEGQEVDLICAASFVNKR